LHLLGSYNVNQVNIFASVPGLSETNFLDAFNKVRASFTGGLNVFDSNDYSN